MKVTARAYAITMLVYALPFLGILVFSAVSMWAGDLEMILAGAALLPAVLYSCGVRWCRYVIGVFATISFLACSAVPFIRGSEGRYFWVIWLPIWLLFGFSALMSFVPVIGPQESPSGSDAESARVLR